MRLRLYRHIPEDDDFRRQWSHLVYEMESPAVFYTWEWAQAVARAYAPTTQPLLFAAYRDQLLIGVVAFACDMTSRKVWFLTASTADYCDFVSAPRDRAEFIEVVVGELRKLGIREFRLANLPADSASATVLQPSARNCGYTVFARPAYLCAQVSFDSSEARQKIGQDVRNKLKRTAKALSGMGTITVEHSATSDQFTAEFPQYSTAHVARFLATGRISNLMSCQRRAFLVDLARLLTEQGWLAFSTLKLEGRTFAWNYGFKFAGTWFWYQPAFDPELHRFSPGVHLLCEVLRQASEDTETSIVDMGLGDEGYKARYANAGRQILHITASRSRRRKAWESSRYRAAELVKRSPGLERRLRQSRSQMSVFRKRIATTGFADSGRFYFSRFMRYFFNAARVYFFEWNAPQILDSDPQVSLQPLSIALLASAAMAYENEHEIVEYLLRSARMHSGGTEGFALINSEGVPVHFCWIAPFNGFRLDELGQVLQEPEVGSVLLFDSWTPPTLRGRGYYTQCISLVASHLLNKGKHPWTYSTAARSSSFRGIQRAGFVPRFSLVRKKRLHLDRISKLEFTGTGSTMLDLNRAA
jgi:CelD/BcsL family acetyltransferase involved in cellulose biosynthesis